MSPLHLLLSLLLLPVIVLFTRSSSIFTDSFPLLSASTTTTTTRCFDHRYVPLLFIVPTTIRTTTSSVSALTSTSFSSVEEAGQDTISSSSSSSSSSSLTSSSTREETKNSNNYDTDNDTDTENHKTTKSLKDDATTATQTTAISDPNPTQPKAYYDSVICGGGPAGLLAAIMLAQKYGPSYKIGVCERRSTIPPSPFNPELWSDVARFYLLGIGFRGQRALETFGLLPDFMKASVAVSGRRDWAPGKTKVEESVITRSTKDVTSRVLARDKLVGVLYYHIVEHYSAYSNIDLLYGYEVEPISFGTDTEDSVRVQISKCTSMDDDKKKERQQQPQNPQDRLRNNDDNNDNNNDAYYVASQDSNEECDVESSSSPPQQVTTKLLIAADGSARTVANAMEKCDREEYQQLNILNRLLLAPKPFTVKRYVDDNARVFKSVKIPLPSDWPCDLNYSARSSESRITLEALPSDMEGNLCALLLMKPDDELAQENVPLSTLRAYFQQEFPQFSTFIDDQEMERVATKAASALPSFRYAGPRLTMKRRTVVLGDAAHTVKPYFGLGANSAMEDIVMLSEALDETAKIQDAGNDNNNNNNNNDDEKEEDTIPKALQLFSKRRAGDSEALVKMSRNMDRPGKLFIVTFVIPIILDGIFHKIAPKVFGPNMFGMFQRQDLGFKQIQRKKRFDRVVQLVMIGGILTTIGMGLRTTIQLLARRWEKSQLFVSASLAMTGALGILLKKTVAFLGTKQEEWGPTELDPQSSKL